MDQQTAPLICPSHKTQYIAVFIVGLIAGGATLFAFFAQTGKIAVAGNTYQAGFVAAKKLVQESPAGTTFTTADDIRVISGKVTNIDENRVTIHTESHNPFDDPALLDRTVMIKKDTKITVLIPGDMKSFQLAMATFIKNTQLGKKTNTTPPIPPVSNITSVDASRIVNGATITVTATENIKTMKEFTASEIRIQ